MLQLTPKKEIKLRPYQLQAVEGLREGIRAGINRQILVAPTGAGKTVIASHLLRQADQKGKYALFLVDRVALVKQTSGTLDDYGIPHGIVQGINERWHPYENVQVCSIQTLARRSLPRRPELIIYDEAHCFVAGTLVETPSGPRPIEEIAVGDEIYTAIGIGCVRHAFCNPANELVRVNFDDRTRSYAPLSINSLPATHGCKPGSWMDRARSASKTCPACGNAFRPRISKTAAGSWLAEHEGYWNKRRCCSQSCAKRLKNPMHRAASRERMATTLRSAGHRPSVMGGNGRGMTEPQRLLLQKLGSGWIAELAVSTGTRPATGSRGTGKST